MKRIGVFDAKTHLSQLLEEVHHGRQRFIIQRRGKDVAALVPCEEVTERSTQDEAREIIEAFRAIREKQKPLGPGESIKSFIEEGRKW